MTPGQAQGGASKDTPEVIDLGRGQPGFDLLPQDVLRKAAERRLAEDDPRLLQYGPEAGPYRFREVLAGFLSRHHGNVVAPESLFISAGASHGLDLYASRNTRPGDVVVVEEPTYFHALSILKARGLTLRTVAVDAGGPDVEALDDLLTGERVAFIYTIPTFQNPTGVTMDEARRAAFVRVARDHGVPIVADEVYQTLWFDRPPPPPLRHYDPSVTSVGSFSKILAPGLRLGWLETTSAMVEELGRCGVRQSGGGVAPFTAALVRRAIEDGLQDEYLLRIRAEYARRRDVLSEALSTYAPSLTFTLPVGGFFVWATLPPDVDARDLATRAAAEGVTMRIGPDLTPNEGTLLHKLRLSDTFHTPDEIVEGVRRLSRALG